MKNNPDLLTNEEIDEHVINILDSINDVKKLSDVMIILHEVISQLFEGSMDDHTLSQKEAFEGFTDWAGTITSRIVDHNVERE